MSDSESTAREALVQLVDDFDEYLLWRPGERGHAAAHRALCEAVDRARAALAAQPPAPPQEKLPPCCAGEGYPGIAHDLNEAQTALRRIEHYHYDVMLDAERDLRAVKEIARAALAAAGGDQGAPLTEPVAGGHATARVAPVSGSVSGDQGQNPTEGRSDEGDGGWDSPATRKRAGAEATSESVVPPSSEPSPARAHEAAGGDPGNAPAGHGGDQGDENA